MTILEQIVADKRKEIEQTKRMFPITILETSPYYQRKVNSVSDAIRQSQFGIIAEFKRRSPSKRAINLKAQAHQIVPEYELNGAVASSVLTDEKYFGGTMNDLRIARNSAHLPLLRKDFIVDPYQIHEAKAFGADFILLIAACLSPKQVVEFSTTASELGLEVLLELHDQSELGHYFDGIDLIGVNNRNLKTFEVSIENSIQIANQLPSDCIKIAESGLSTPANIIELYNHGFNGFLIGESFMRSENPGLACKQLIYTSKNLINKTV